MNVASLWGPAPTTKPYREKAGVTLAYHEGDFLDLGISPLDYMGIKNEDGSSRWYRVPGFPGAKWSKRRMLWLSVRVGRFGFYIGGKVFGVDLPEYAYTLGAPRQEIFPGSIAMVFTARFTGDLT